MSQPKLLLSPQCVLKKLKQHKRYIDLLLSRKASIVSVIPFIKQQINLIPNVPFYGCISANSQPKPLKIGVMLSRGINTTNIYLSQTAERPNKNSCDTTIIISKRNYVVTYYGKNKEKLFNHPFVYFSIESEIEIDISINCYFEKRLKEKKAEELSTKLAEKYGRISSPIIDNLINQIKSNPTELMKCNKMAMYIKKKRMKRYLGNNNEFIRNRAISRKRFVGCLKNNVQTPKKEHKRHEKAVILRDKIDDKETFKKFFIAYKVEITQILVFI